MENFVLGGAVTSLHGTNCLKQISFLHHLAEWAVVLGFGALTFLFWVAHFNNYDRDLFSDSVYHRSARPFVYRTLLPTTVNVLTRLFPAAARSAVKRYVSNNPTMRQAFTVDGTGQGASGHLKFEKLFPIETVIGLLLMFCSLIGFLFTAGRLFRIFYYVPAGLQVWIPAAAALGFLPWISYTSHPYDLTTLLLSSLYYYQLARGRWRSSLAIFFLACLNKETAILYTVAFAVYVFLAKLSQRLALGLIGAQLLIFAAIRLTLTFLFRANPGNVLEFHLFDINAALFARWLQKGVSLNELAIRVAIVIAVCHGWKQKPLLFRSGLAVIPPLACLGLFFGVFDEWRQYTDAYTPLLMLCLGSICWLFGVRRRAAETEKAPEAVRIET